MRIIPWLRPNCLTVREQNPVRAVMRALLSLGTFGFGTACDAGQGAFVGSEEQVGQGVAASIGDPALRQVMRPVVQQVAALAEGPQVGEPVVCGIAVEMGGGKHDAGGTQPDGLDQVGPPGWPAPAVPPGLGGLIEPAAIRQAAQPGQMRPSAALALSSRPLEAHTVA